ncbi:hypothetical protein ZWY2020_052589 [Hordeum vulgare]|nr:hypothetical protein ZWY2020_052589 [Hordeum vulgare]
MTVGGGIRPSPSKVINVPSASEGSEEFDEETLQAIIRNKQERVAQASGSSIPLAMDLKVLLDFINLWYEVPNTPVDDLKLPPGVSHMVATFINEAKWKEQQAKQEIAAKLKKEEFLKQNLLKLTHEGLVSTQAELKTLTDKYTSLHSNRQGVKLPEEDETEEPAAEEIPQNTPAEETARPDTEPVREEIVPSPQPSKVKKVTPCASDVKKTKAAEKEAKKRKASMASETSEAKRMKVTRSESSSAPVDATPLNVAPSYMLVPFGVDHVIPEEDEEIDDAQDDEIMDE